MSKVLGLALLGSVLLSTAKSQPVTNGQVLPAAVGRIHSGEFSVADIDRVADAGRSDLVPDL